jgi:immune inhibitor A
MRRSCVHDRYEYGPTACVAHPKVMKNIVKELRAAHAISSHEVRLAAMMGLAPTDSASKLGFNDGIIYPAGFMPRKLTRGATLSSAMGLAPMTTTRKLHALALMVDFSDNQGTRPAADFQKLLFDAANPSSLTSYYKTLSGGQLEVTGEAIGYVRGPRPYTFYTNGESGTGSSYPNNTPGLLFDALTAFCVNDNLKRFDSDNDGFVDGIFLIHAGGGAEAEADPAKRKDMIWSHKWTLPTPFINSGVQVFAYSTEPEDGHVGVFCHEFGHVLGLPDLYDTTYRSEGVGMWCLMGAGSWGGNGNKPVRMSCWCLAKLGWITPQNFSGTKTLTIPTLASDPTACYRLPVAGASGPEYFLLENRQTVDMDSALPGHGLALWHIDEHQAGNTDPLGYLVGLVQADGKQDLEKNRNRGDDGDLFPGSAGITSASDGTNPNTRANDGSPSGVTLTGITEVGTTIKVKVKA